MAKTKARNLAEFIVPLEMNGLQGRMLRLPPPKNKKREILLIYGSHASLERMFGMAEFLNRYGAVTVPDLPGFGGMEPFYKIGEKPTLDNLADYMAAFIKLRYKRRKVTIVGTSFGFLVVTRMLQNYPELTKRVEMLISFVGFLRRDDFKIPKSQYFFFRWLSSLVSNRLPAFFFKHVVFRPFFIKLMYTVFAPNHARMKDADRAERDARVEFETYLWQCNDMRTRADTNVTFLTADLCDRQIDLPVYHIAVNNDHYFDNSIVEQHMNVVFSEVHMMDVDMPAHAPTVMASADEVGPFVPTKIRRLLARPPSS